MTGNRRDFYRIPYPPEDRPRFVLGDSIGEVLDCSERGLRFRSCSPEPPSVGQRVAGRLRFQRGEELFLTGCIVRIEEDEIAIHFEEAGIPFGTILQEQFYLRRVAR
jgi:hypothetical protein